MTSPARRRAPRTPEQRQSQWTRSMTPGTQAGQVANASPILPGLSSGRAQARAVAAAFGGGSSVLAFHQIFDLTAAGPQAKTLTYLPLEFSEHVYLNGLYQREPDDWTRTGQTVNVQAAMDARVGDVLAVEYLYAASLPVSPSSGDSGDIIGFTSSSSVNPVLTVPAGTQAGDLMVMAYETSGAFSGSTPVFTAYSGNTGRGIRTRIADGTETSVAVTDSGGNFSRLAYTLTVLRAGSITSNAVVTGSAASSAIPAVTGAAGNIALVVAFLNNGTLSGTLSPASSPYVDVGYVVGTSAKQHVRVAAHTFAAAGNSPDGTLSFSGTINSWEVRTLLVVS